MLYLSRKVGESIVIQGTIEVTVMEVRGQKVRLGCTFPKGVQVLRRELVDRISQQNQQALEAYTLLKEWPSTLEEDPGS